MTADEPNSVNQKSVRTSGVRSRRYLAWAGAVVIVLGVTAGVGTAAWSVDDKGGQHQTEPGDDNGGQHAQAERGDDKGGQQAHTERWDDRGGHGGRRSGSSSGDGAGHR
ncbi:hypothetical protein OHA10_15175 [Kribbella sp. NBC_00662]|uniref:hypothetical protein n=1 Tax=Kribbella sp. NBC_00662 TaxID=2975969 RepID=UPI00325545E5